MPKKNLIEQALLEAKELERASIDNAKDIVLESFTPDFVNFFKDILTEGDDEDEDDVPVDSDAEGDDDDEEEDEDDMVDEAEHDLGKFPDPGREGTDPALDDDEEQGKEYQVSEGEYDDVSGDPTPEKGQAGLPSPKPKVKQTGDSGWEDEGTAGMAADDPEKNKSDIPGKKPAVKQTGDGGWEEEGSEDAATPAPREKLAGTPKPKTVFAEAEDDESDDSDEELDVPDELFDDEDSDSVEGTDSEDDVDVVDDFDGEDSEDVDLDIEDDEEDSVEEADDPMEDDDESEDDESEDEEEDAKEEVAENLYVRRGGEYKKITPAEYLNSRIGTLKEEVAKRDDAIATLRGQLRETHLFNAKLAHLNKLYMTGAFTNSEKERIAERLDECESIDDVKSLYKTIIREVQNTNPLDDFAATIKEHRISKKGKTENIYESSDVARMKRIMNYKFED